jgi:hypothetical protein
MSRRGSHVVFSVKRAVYKARDVAECSPSRMPVRLGIKWLGARLARKQLSGCQHL